MADFNLATVNVNGLGGTVKRRALFALLRRQKCGIAFLQETHSMASQERIWSSELGGGAYFSHGSSGARGLAILFSPSLPVSVLSVHRDANGHFLLMQVSLDGWEFTLLNIYAPTADQPDGQMALLDEVENLIHSSDSLNLFIGGDLNCCLDPEMDRFSREANVPLYNRRSSDRARSRLENLMEGCHV